LCRKAVRLKSHIAFLDVRRRQDTIIDMRRVQTGLEVLLETPELIGGRGWALLANQAAVTADLDPARTALQAVKPGPLVRLFAPEHGLDGVEQDMEAVVDARDPITGCQVRSLYGSTAETLAPAPEDLEDVDVIVADLPDIGARYYTFAATLDWVMAACENAMVEVMVVDRPNPIGGVGREGGLVEEGFESFVSQLPVPIRHGLTLGEIALLLQRERYPQLELTVIPCRGWRRRDWFDATGLPWVLPSPNMPTIDTAGLYPGLCLVEATTLSEGRGTTRPFQLIGAPWLNAEGLVARLRGLDLSGVGFRPARFRPTFGKHAGDVCSGVELHLTDRQALEPVALGMHLLKTIHDLHPEHFSWRSDPYEFVGDVPALDILTGSSAARKCVENGLELDSLFESWRKSVAAFESRLDRILLYHDPD
jgi:uncharacterized protein YbbC (DUF1343 family)